MRIEFLNEKNSDEIREYLLSSPSEVFLDEAFKESILKYPTSQFRHMFFIGNLVAYGMYDGNNLKQLALFYVPGTESKFIQALVLPKSDLNFFKKVLSELSPLINEERIKKVKLRTHELENSSDEVMLKDYGFVEEVKIPLKSGTHLHMAYFL